MTLATLAISVGEPAGIGPDILIKAAQQTRALPWVVFGCGQTLLERAAALKLPLTLEAYQADCPSTQHAGRLTLIDYPMAKAVHAQALQVANSPCVVRALVAATQFCLAEPQQRALVTLPIHKGIINQADIPFTGHTECLAEQSGVAKVVMMLGCERVKVALQTIHIPLKQVPLEITASNISRTVDIIDRHWRRFYGKRPRILVLGVNPHAGEQGYLGQEEQQVMVPVLQQLQQHAYQVTGPVAADTAFTPQALTEVDVVLAMYHDQGLAPLKALAFGEVVNYTLGLPFIRTSVDHGVALAIAGTGQAQCSSFLAAVKAASDLLLASKESLCK